MGKQSSVIHFQGKVDGISYYYDRLHGQVARRPGGPSKIQIKHDKAFATVRKNNSDFGTASQGGKLIRHAFDSIIQIAADSTINVRLVSALQAILKADIHQRHGSRTLNNSNLAQFKHFDLNTTRKADYYFQLPVLIDKQKKGIEINATVKLPEKKKVQGASHWKVVSILAEVDFAKQKFELHKDNTKLYSLKAGREVITLQHPVRAGGLYFHGMCISFFEKEVNEYEMLKGQALNAGFIGCVET